MIMEKLYQKYLLVLFCYPPKLVLGQYVNFSNFLIFGVFQMFFLHKKSLMSLRLVFSDRITYI